MSPSWSPTMAKRQRLPVNRSLFSAVSTPCGQLLSHSPAILSLLVLSFSSSLSFTYFNSPVPFDLFLLLHTPTPHSCSISHHALLDTKSPFPMPCGHATPGLSSSMAIPLRACHLSLPCYPHSKEAAFDSCFPFCCKSGGVSKGIGNNLL